MKAAKPSIAPTRSRSKSGELPGASVLGAAADFGRQQAVVATESASALFRGFEAIRKIQEDVAHKASKRHADAACQLRSNCSPADVLAVQSALLRFDVEAASEYWQGIAAATFEMQAQIMDCASHLLNTESILAGTSTVDAMESRVPAFEAFLTWFPTLRKTSTDAYGSRAEAS